MTAESTARAAGDGAAAEAGVAFRTVCLARGRGLMFEAGPADMPKAL